MGDVVVATWTVGNTDPLPQTWPSTGSTAFTMASFVTMLGGEHVVAPSMAFLSGLLSHPTGRRGELPRPATGALRRPVPGGDLDGQQRRRALRHRQLQA